MDKKTETKNNGEDIITDLETAREAIGSELVNCIEPLFDLKRTTIVCKTDPVLVMAGAVSISNRQHRHLYYRRSIKKSSKKNWFYKAHCAPGGEASFSIPPSPEHVVKPSGNPIDNRIYEDKNKAAKRLRETIFDDVRVPMGLRQQDGGYITAHPFDYNQGMVRHAITNQTKNGTLWFDETVGDSNIAKYRVIAFENKTALVGPDKTIRAEAKPPDQIPASLKAAAYI